MARPPIRPTPLPVSPQQIPDALKSRSQWVVWRYVWLEDREKWDKPPLSAPTLEAASSTNAETWATFEAGGRHVPGRRGGRHRLCAEQGSGPGGQSTWIIAATPTAASSTRGRLTSCRRSPAIPKSHPQGQACGCSPGARCPPAGARWAIEKSMRPGRYLTLTGCHLQDTPRTIEACQPAIDDVYQRIFSDAPGARSSRPSSNGAGPAMSQ